MFENSFFDKVKLNSIFTPLAIVIFSCSLLIIINFFTIKILSSSRAYVNGESHYSQAQKDGTRHLITYLFTKDSSEWNEFIADINVTIGDRDAREAFYKNPDDIDVIKKNLRIGRNNEKDLDDMIWMFKYFHKVSLLANAIEEWEKGDVLIQDLLVIGNQIRETINSGPLTEKDRNIFLNKIRVNSIELTKMEHQFSNILGEGTRIIKSYLLILNIIITLIIIGCISIYYSAMVNKIKRSNFETEEKNRNLIIANKELDKFVYSASHDIRAPISTLKGLIEVMKLEDNMEQMKDYLSLMDLSLNKQDQFIRDIINYSRNKRTEISISLLNLEKLIEQAITKNKYFKEKNNIVITKNIEVEEFYSDELRLNIILDSLISNAFNYYDTKKDKHLVSINTFKEGQFYKIEIEDNGIGINEEKLNKIFEMFFVTNNNNKGSGLGLYVAKEACENLDGYITVNSKINIGSTFIITIPIHHES